MGKIYRISGRVVDIATGEGIEGLRVEAWDKDLIFNDLLGSAITDGKGRFQVGFQDADFKDVIGDDNVDLFFRVFKEGVLVKSTEDLILWDLKDEPTEIQIDVDLNTGDSNTS